MDSDLPDRCRGCQMPAEDLIEEEQLFLMVTGYCMECASPEIFQRLDDALADAMTVKH